MLAETSRQTRRHLVDARRFVLGALLIGTAIGTCRAEAPGHDAAWVDERVRAWQPTAAERRFDDIGWAKDIRVAEELARKHRRPVFLFTHDGHIQTGRC
jgi:hypothetical protein